jgi:hypothetical protein
MLNVYEGPESSITCFTPVQQMLIITASRCSGLLHTDTINAFGTKLKILLHLLHLLYLVAAKSAIIFVITLRFLCDFF